jgi:hypothetical protein
VPWKAATLAAESAHTLGTQQALQEKRFSKGVQASSDGRWAEKTLGKGAERFGPGVADAQSDYEAGVAPYSAALNALTLPPRGPKGDPKNIERVRVVAAALRRVKTGS